MEQKLETGERAEGCAGQRILHVVPGMHWGGVETWVSRIGREIKDQGFEFDVIVPNDQIDESFASHARDHLRIVRAPSFRERFRFFTAVATQIRRGGPYCGVHSHLCASNAVIIAIARSLGVPVTVAHSHIDLRHEKHSPTKHLYRRTSAAYLARFSGARLACGRDAAESEFGTARAKRPEVQTLIGIDWNLFSKRAEPDPGARAELGILAGTPVVTHIGRFERQKNHSFLLRVFAAAVAKRPDLRLLLIGSGPLESEILSFIKQADLTNSVMLLGRRRDAVRILTEATNVFLFPSEYEGLPVAFLEAQAAGLPCVASDRISTEAIVFPRRVTVLSLEDSYGTWADATIAALRAPQESDRTPVLEEMNRRGLTIAANAKLLAAEYSRQLRAQGANKERLKPANPKCQLS